MPTFPSIRTGVVTQLPFVAEQYFSNSVVVMPSGLQYSYYYDASPLMRWEVNYPVLTPDELSTLRTFASDAGGAWDSFTFVDPDTGTSYPKCRFGRDSFSYDQTGPAISARLIIEEFR